MANLAVRFFVAQEPSKPEGGLKNTVHNRRPVVRVSVSRETSRQECIFRRITVPAVGSITDESVKRQKEGPVVLLPDAHGERTVCHEIRRSRNVAARMQPN